MDFRLNDDEQMVYDLCTRFAKEQLAEAGADADRARECPQALIDKGLELGMFLDAIPADAGGYLEDAYSQTQRTVRALALSAGCPTITLRYEANTETALAAAALQQSDILKDLAENAGGSLGCTVIEDPANPLDVSSGTLNGTANAVANALGAAWLVVVSNQNAATPFVALVAGKDVDVTAQSSMGLIACAVGNIDFKGASPVALVTGSDAAALAQTLRNSYKTLAAALGIGSANAAIDYAEAYAADRIQFGQPIGRFQALARLIEENRGCLEAARFHVLAASQAMDHGEYATRICQNTSAFAGEAATRAAIDAVQVFGGYGFVNDYPVEKIMRDVRACTTLAGDGLQEQVMAASVLAA